MIYHYLWISKQFNGEIQTHNWGWIHNPAINFVYETLLFGMLLQTRTESGTKGLGSVPLFLCNHLPYNNLTSTCSIFNVVMFCCACFHSIKKEEYWNMKKRKEIWIKMLKASKEIHGNYLFSGSHKGYISLFHLKTKYNSYLQWWKFTDFSVVHINRSRFWAQNHQMGLKGKLCAKPEWKHSNSGNNRALRNKGVMKELVNRSSCRQTKIFIVNCFGCEICWSSSQT